MHQLEGDGIIGPIHSDTVLPSQYGIDPLDTEEFGYHDTMGHPDDHQGHSRSFGMTSDSSRRDSLVAEVESRMLRRPLANRQRNSD